MLKAIGATLIIMAHATVAYAEDTRTYGITAAIEAGNLKGVPCTLRADGKTMKLVTPAKVELPVDKAGVAILDSLECTYKSITRKTTTFGDSRSVKVEMNFDNPPGLGGGVIFFKSNGGVSTYLNEDGTLVRVS